MYKVGSSASEVMQGSNIDELFFAFAGNDIIYAHGGNDVVNAGAGNDIVFAGSGDDIVYGGLGDNWLYGDSGSDVLRVSGSGFNYVNGGSGVDLASFTDMELGVYASLLNGQVKQIASHPNEEIGRLVKIENLQGSSFSDYLHGNLGANAFWAGSGSDTVYGLDGNDTLYGENGDDFLSGGNGEDFISGGRGNDILEDTEGQNHIDGGEGIDTASFQGSYHGIYASIRGLVGFATSEVLYSVLHSIENLRGSSHDDTLIGSQVTNSISGNSGNDVIWGHGGDDFLDGGFGNDTINGGSGDDTLVGAGGGDVFVFDTNSGLDRILDFQENDKINLTNHLGAHGWEDVFDVHEHTEVTGGGDLTIYLGNDAITLVDYFDNWFSLSDDNFVF